MIDERVAGSARPRATRWWLRIVPKTAADFPRQTGSQLSVRVAVVNALHKTQKVVFSQCINSSSSLYRNTHFSFTLGITDTDFVSMLI